MRKRGPFDECASPFERSNVGFNLLAGPLSNSTEINWGKNSSEGSRDAPISARGSKTSPPLTNTKITSSPAISRAGLPNKTAIPPQTPPLPVFAVELFPFRMASP